MARERKASGDKADAREGEAREASKARLSKAKSSKAKPSKARSSKARALTGRSSSHGRFKAVWIVASLLIVVVALGAAQVQLARGATPGWGLMDRFSAAPGESGAIAQRRTVRLGVGGDLPLASPHISGAVVAERDAIASLSSDAALANAAFLPTSDIKTLATPYEETAALGRVAALRVAETTARTALDDATETPYDVEIATALDISHLEGTDRFERDAAENELYCLAEAIYFEARGEPLTGQAAVAEVVLNRVDSEFWPDTICGVVNQGSYRRTGCQFSYTCDGLPETINSPEAWDIAEKIATLMMRGAPRRITGHATHYHADYVSPRWANTMELTTVVGRHLFFRRLLRFAHKTPED